MEKLTDELLRHAFYLMTDAAMQGGDEYTTDGLVGTLFNHSVDMKWIEEPPEGECELGDWNVPKEYLDEFYDRCMVHQGIPQFGDGPVTSAIIEENGTTPFSTNPNETINKFCRVNNETIHEFNDFVRLVAPDEYDKTYVDENVARRIFRMRLRPKRYRIPTASQKTFAKTVRDAMAKHDPARYGQLDHKDLLWIR